jgi:hypothetical protein
VCSCFFDEERYAFFFAGSEREREKREKARAKKKKRRERFVAFLSRVESIMRGQKAACDDAQI